jgi:hypothetical protein
MPRDVAPRDAVQDRYVIVRHVRLGTSQLIAFTPMGAAPVTWSPQESPPD